MGVSLCLISMLMAMLYVMIFIASTIYLVAVNRCKFNKRTKVVISILSVQMTLAMGAVILTYTNETQKGTCSVYPLAYTLQAY